MTEDLNPQAKEMADESMVRNLAAQAEAIWPQERRLFDRYHLREDSVVLDAGCGTGEIAWRVLEDWPDVRVVGVDLVDGHLERARVRCAAHGSRARFEHQSVFGLSYPDATFDVTMCRHVLQAVPYVDRVVAELVRVTRPQGWVHLLAEDYLMISFERRSLDPDDFWYGGPREFGRATGTDLRIGRRAYGILRRLGLVDLAVDYAVVDPLRVPRETFAAIWRAWRDGYADIVAAHSPVTREAFIDHFNDMIATIEDPDGYGVWHVPIVSGRVP